MLYELLALQADTNLLGSRSLYFIFSWVQQPLCSDLLMRKTNRHVEIALGFHHALLQLYEREKRWETMKFLTPSSLGGLVRSRVFQLNLPRYFRSCSVFSIPQLSVSLSSLMGRKSFKESEPLSECELLSDFKNTVLTIKVAKKQKELEQVRRLLRGRWGTHG